MKKIGVEIWLVAASVCFLLSWLIDRLAGPVSINIGNPVAFLTSSLLLHKYPFTATAILIRSIGLFISSIIISSLIEKKYFTKAVVLFFIGMLAEFFAIQQLATGFHVTTIQWTLSIAYASVLLALSIFWFLLKGVWMMFGGKEQKSHSSSEESSVLQPTPKE